MQDTNDGDEKDGDIAKDNADGQQKRSEDAIVPDFESPEDDDDEASATKSITICVANMLKLTFIIFE